MTSVQQHTFTLAKYVHNKMAAMHHGNGSTVARIYCHGEFDDSKQQGPIVNFNLLRSDGSYVGYAEVRISDFLLFIICDMIKGKESLVENVNFNFLTPVSHDLKTLHFDANPITIGYLVMVTEL